MQSEKIGTKFIPQKRRETQRTGFFVPEFSAKIDGLSISWGQDDMKAYYVDLSEANSISLQERKNSLLSLFTQSGKTFICLDAKQQFKYLFLGLNFWFSRCHDIRDPQIGSWLLDPDAKPKSLFKLVTEYSSHLTPILSKLNLSKGVGSIGLMGNSKVSSRYRSTTEAVLVKFIMTEIERDLKDQKLFQSFTDVEMPSIISFLRMELNGVGFCGDESDTQRKLILNRMSELEQEAYDLAERTNFSLSSHADIKRILYLELRLPFNGGDPNFKGKSLSFFKDKRNFKLLSTSKDILIKLKDFHKLPAVILEWRKLNSSITQIVNPMQKARLFHPELKMDRIYTKALTLSCTGRISLTEPNIQNIPKDFEVALDTKVSLDYKSADIKKLETSLNSAKLSTTLLDDGGDDDDEDASSYKVSIRHAVIASKDCLILAADYSQLELRILAHLSEDSELKNILNADGDAFKMVASKWKKKDINEVTAEERQVAKQICYGIIYGIGSKGLGELLGVVDEEAKIFMEDFKSAFPRMKVYLEEVVERCKQNGYITTMYGRRRYLPDIRLSRTSTRNASYLIAHAERQAVNSTIQGSSADLVKTAMINIDRTMSSTFPLHNFPLRRGEYLKLPLQGGYFILQLHDELLYEVVAKNVIQVAHIVKNGMENACRLKVKTPIKLKVGPSWGTLQTLEL